ncbi:transposase [Natranaerovirga hydrolytica]|uniref:Transposase n=1 Tax=Natranaerovirga hydrolytica TaxID=680378 RepID=A0A4R1MZH8_9FIRM|nr:transposase [Natranaerovirga hydrolytica]TCK97972.1 transposase [Natranaerovirga hydrolytica]
MANNKYDPNLQKKIIRLHLEEGRSVKSLTDEYNLGSRTLRYWLDKHREECKINPELKNESDILLVNQKLRKELAEAKNENDFLKKASAFFAKEID